MDDLLALPKRDDVDDNDVGVPDLFGSASLIVSRSLSLISGGLFKMPDRTHSGRGEVRKKANHRTTSAHEDGKTKALGAADTDVPQCWFICAVSTTFDTEATHVCPIVSVPVTRLA